MFIECGNLHARIVRATDDERTWLREYLSFEDTQAKFAKKRYGSGDGRVRMFDIFTGTFPTGLLPLVRKAGPMEGFQIDLLDSRKKPCEPDWTVDLKWLRDYQLAAVRNAVAFGRGIISAPTGCITGDAIIDVYRAGKSFRLPLRDLVMRFNGGRITWQKSGRRNRVQGSGMYWDQSIPTMVRSCDPDGYIRLHQLCAATYSGMRRTYDVQLANGKSLRATADHKFLTPDGWVELQQLHIGSKIITATNKRLSGSTAKKPSWYKIVNGLQKHPFAGRRGVDPGKGGWSVPTHRLIAEAVLNGWEYTAYVKALRQGRLPDSITYLDPKKYHVHHVDLNPQNNAVENLAVMLSTEHRHLHGIDNNWKNVTAKTTVDTVSAISGYDEEDTYDLTLTNEPHNFVANGIVVHNSGKTELAIALHQVLSCRWLFLVHRTTLVEQAAERFTLRTGQTADIIGEGRWENTGATFTCASFQSIYSALKRKDPRVLVLLQQIQGLLVDEVHVLPSDTYWRVSMTTQQAYYRFGLSGTPLARGDRRSLLAIASTGPIIYRIQPDVLIAAGVLAKPRIQLVPVAQLSTCKTWQGVYGECIVRSRTRNQTIVDCAKRAEKPCLVFVKEIQHGRLLTERLLKANLRAEFVFGADSTPERQAATRRLVRGDLDVLVSSVIFQEGVDIPQLRSVVIANGGRSVIAALQRIGRGMRVTADKNTFQVWDVADHGCKLLERHTKARVRAYTSQGYETVEAML